MTGVIKDFLRLGRRCMHQIAGRDIAWPTRVRQPTMHLGTEYGGWWIIPSLVPKNACVFSVGIGQDISFDLEMMQKFGARVYGFDPTPKSVQWIKTQNVPSQFHFVPIGLAEYDGLADFGLDRPDWESYSTLLPTSLSVDRATCRVARISTLMKEVNVSQVDILKIDIEGSEYKSIPDVLQSGTVFPQLLLELHYQTGIRNELERARELLRSLEESGYLLFRRTPVGREFSFVHTSALRQGTRPPAASGSAAAE